MPIADSPVAVTQPLSHLVADVQCQSRTAQACRRQREECWTASGPDARHGGREGEPRPESSTKHTLC